jgi:hypothetical protein
MRIETAPSLECAIAAEVPDAATRRHIAASGFSPEYGGSMASGGHEGVIAAKKNGRCLSATTADQFSSGDRVSAVLCACPAVPPEQGFHMR